jgi:hypothetical protein
MPKIWLVGGGVIGFGIVGEKSFLEVENAFEDGWVER